MYPPTKHLRPDHSQAQSQNYNKSNEGYTQSRLNQTRIPLSQNTCKTTNPNDQIPCQNRYAHVDTGGSTSKGKEGQPLYFHNDHTHFL